MTKACIIDGCKNKGTIARKVGIFKELDDFRTVAYLCSAHKKRLKSGDSLLCFNFEDYSKLLLKENNKKASETIDYMVDQAALDDRLQSVQLTIDAAMHYARLADAKFLFGFYYAALFIYSSFKGFDTNVARQKRAKEIRSKMSLKEPYPEREHPSIADQLEEVCKCGHVDIMHDYGQPRGKCYTCICPRYEFEQRLSYTEVSDLGTLLYRELKIKD
jgi:hypothetical protein